MEERKRQEIREKFDYLRQKKSNKYRIWNWKILFSKSLKLMVIVIMITIWKRGIW